MAAFIGTAPAPQPEGFIPRNGLARLRKFFSKLFGSTEKRYMTDAEAVAWLETAAQRSSRAALRLGTMLEFGDGVERDLERARAYYEKARQMGDPNATQFLQMSAGERPHAKEKPVRRQTEPQLPDPLPAGELPPADAQADPVAGPADAEPPPDDNTPPYAEPPGVPRHHLYPGATEAAPVRAQDNQAPPPPLRGVVPVSGIRLSNLDPEEAPAPDAPVVPTDPAALDQIREAAARGQGDAQLLLALHLAEGRGMARDLPRAIDWLRQIAERADPLAEYNLGVLLLNGEAGPEDTTAEGARRVKHAAELGLPEAAYLAGCLHMLGRGLPRDETAAFRCWYSAGCKGYAPARQACVRRYNRGLLDLTQNEAHIVCIWQQVLRLRPASRTPDGSGLIPLLWPASTKLAQPIASPAAVVVSPDDAPPALVPSEPMQALSAMVGMDEIKRGVEELRNYIMAEQIRQQFDLPAEPLSLHMVMSGPPGTGKSQVARLIGSIYHELGVLKSGHLVEKDRAGLVGSYQGHTAPLVDQAVQEALDGVLFIDEAYALKSDDGCDDSFGQEAINALVKRMEDYRDRLVVIVAGYTGPMEQFIRANAGLRSRFTRHFRFVDYTPEQLLQIFQMFCANARFVLSPPAEARLRDCLTQAYATRDASFGNGRLVRNLYEASRCRQATRIVALPEVTREDLITLLPEDIPDSAGDLPSAI